MKNVKRLLSLVLALAMLLTMASFPAFAAEYTYTPKTVVLEGSNTWWNDYGGHRGIIRPTNDLYKGDKLSFGDGVVMGQIPQVTDGGVKYDVVGFRLDANPYASGGAWLGQQKYVRVETVDGVTTLKGFYSSQEAMLAGTGATSDFALNYTGKWGFAWGGIFYYNGEGTLKCVYGGLDNTGGWNKTYSFFLDVKEVPTSEPVTAPAVLNGLAESATALDVSTFVTDPEDANFTAENNLYYLSFVTFDASATTKYFYATKKAANAANYNGYHEGPRFEFAQKAYIKDITINIEQGYLKCDVFGSLDNENWYPLTIGAVSTGSNNHKIEVNGIAKYLRVDVRALPQTWNALDGGIALKGVTATFDVPDSWTVTVDGLTSATLKTDINGKVDFSSIAAQYPAGGYVYKVDGEDVTEALANGTYAFTGNKTVTVGYAPYDYVAKDIVLEASMNSYRYFAGQTIIARPSNHNIFKGDKLVLPEGGLALKEKPANLPTVNKAPTGIVLNVYQTFKWSGSFINGKEQFYLAIDYTKSEFGTVTGIYPTMADMVAGTNKMDGIVFEKSGLYVFGIAKAVYHDETTEAAEYQWSNQGWYDNANNNGNGTLFTLTVKEAPEIKDYEVSAPAKLNGLAANATAIDVASTFVADPKSADFVATNNLLYTVRVMTRGSTTNNIPNLEKRPLVYNTDSSKGTVNYMMAYTESVNFDFAKKAYIKDMVIKMEPNAIVTDVYGSLDGENWYVISQRVLSSGSVSHTINVDAVVKYLRVDFVDSKQCGGNWEGQGGISITSLNGILDVPESWDVTFTDGTNTETVKTDINGFYTVPSAFKGDVKYYADAEYTKALNTAVPVKGNTTVYVKANVYEYTPKTVVFQIKNTPSGVGLGNYYNGPIVPSRETIYVGDTILLPHEAYKDLVSGISGAQEVVSLGCYIERYGSKQDDSGKSNYVGNLADVKFTVTEPGVYNFRTGSYTYIDAEGNTQTGSGSVHGGTYNCVFEVLPAPTTAPKSVVAPATTATGTVINLLDTSAGTDITDTSIAFKKSYGRNLGYAQGGEGNSEIAINSPMGHPNDGALQHPVSQTLYLQFNLSAVSYVDTVLVSGSAIYDYDTYGSLDGEEWYFLNSGIVSSNTFNVKGVAKHIRLVPRSTDAWSATIGKYIVRGYVIDETTVDETPAPSWVKEDGTKTEIESVKELPVAYATSSKNYAVTGWKINTGAGFVNVSLVDIAKMDVEDLGNLHAVVTEIPVAAEALTANLTAKGADAGLNFGADKFINGFYIQGAQIRVPSGEGATAVKSGLRFINILDNALITRLNELKGAGTVASYEYGTLAITETQYVGGDLEMGYVQKNGKEIKKSVGEKLFADAGDFENAYFKYTVCIVDIPESHYATGIVVRPYLTINNTDGSSVTLYGEQYMTSVYSAAKFAITYDKELSDNELTYLENVVDIVEK